MLSQLTKALLSKNQWSVNHSKQIFTQNLIEIKKEDILNGLGAEDKLGDYSYREIMAGIDEAIKDLAQQAIVASVPLDSHQLLVQRLHKGKFFRVLPEVTKLRFTVYYPAGDYYGLDFSYAKKEKIDVKFANDLLVNNYPDLYGRRDKYGRVWEEFNKLEVRREVVVTQYKPYRPAYYIEYGKAIANMWEAPYWWRHKFKELREGESPARNRAGFSFIVEKLLRHVLQDDYQINVAKSWFALAAMGIVNRQVLCFFSAETWVGKSLITEYLFKAITGPRNCVAYEVKQIFQNRFKLGTIVQKTGLILPEMNVGKDMTDFLKDFISNTMQNADTKYEMDDAPLEKNCNIVANGNIKNDKEIVPRTDIPFLRRLIIPKVNETRILGAMIMMPDGKEYPLTQEEINRVVAAGEGKTEEGIADAEEFVNFMRDFTESDQFIDLEKEQIFGYLDPDDKTETLIRAFKKWEKMILATVADRLRAAKHKGFIEYRKNVKCYMLPSIIVKTIVTQLRKDPQFCITFEADQCLGKITDLLVKQFFNNGAPLLSVRQPGINKHEFHIYLDKKRFDEYLDNEGQPPITCGETEGVEVEAEQETTDAPLRKNSVRNAEVTRVTPAPSTEREPVITVIGKKAQPKYLFLDFEFKRHASHPTLVCVSMKYDTSLTTQSYWLYDGRESEAAAQELAQAKEDGITFVAFVADAEASCLNMLGIDPLELKWLDPHIIGLPYRHAASDFTTFADDNYEPEEEIYEDDESTASEEEQYEVGALKDKKRQAASLLGLYQYFTGHDVRELKRVKQTTRNLVIELEESPPIDLQNKIMAYCASDVAILEALFMAITDKGIDLEPYYDLTMFRIRMWNVSLKGLPLNGEKYEELLATYRRAVEQEMLALPEFYKHMPATITKKGVSKKDTFIKAAGLFAQAVKKRGLEEIWPKTATGKFSDSEKTLKGFTQYPEFENLMLAKKRIKNIEFFNPAKENCVSNWVTRDDKGQYWQHPDYGTFGTVTGRNGHRPPTFIMALERKLRPQLLKAPEGYCIIQADYKAQEVWVAGAVSGDNNLLKCVNIDPYLDFARAVWPDLVGQDATKQTNPREREICKQVVLGSFYGLGIANLALRIQQTEEEAKVLRWKFRDYYKTYYTWSNAMIEYHKQNRRLPLMDGWPLMDNYDAKGEYRTLTTMNFPIQGTAQVIMRTVVDLMYQAQLRLCYTLHDEFGILCRISERDKTLGIVTDVMKAACKKWFPSINPCEVEFK